TLKNLLRQGDTAVLEYREVLRAIEKQEAIKDIHRQAGGDPQRLRQLLGEAGHFREVQEFDKEDLDRRGKEATIRKTDADARESKIETTIKQIERHASMLAEVEKNPSLWPHVRRMIIMEDDTPEQTAASIPEEYDPNFVKMTIAKGLTYAQQLEQELGRVKFAHEQKAEAERLHLAREKFAQGKWATDLTRGIPVKTVPGANRPPPP
ncbi:hypothetical protein HKBW3S42_02106, partial [Candidatus Hakubella thermalkaliphila]